MEMHVTGLRPGTMYLIHAFAKPTHDFYSHMDSGSQSLPHHPCTLLTLGDTWRYFQRHLATVGATLATHHVGFWKARLDLQNVEIAAFRAIFVLKKVKNCAAIEPQFFHLVA